MKLGEQLSKASDLILDLMLATRDIQRKKELRKHLTVILTITGMLVEKNVNQNTEKYKAATKAFTDANKAIKDAIKDIEKVAKTIERVAKAVDLAAKVAGYVV